jgi:UDP-galactopyranose mutase
MADLNNYDAIVVGAGLCGGVIARQLAERGKCVLIIERRDHIAGNMYDYIDTKTRILVQKYGPHTFHTNEKQLYDYMCKYGEWQEYFLKCGAQIDGKFTPTPFNFQTIDDFYTPEKASELKARIASYYNGAPQTTIVELLKCEDELIREYAQFLFDKDYSLYTAKQWGISPSEIDVSVLNRVPVVFSYENGYFDDEYQVMPKVSFTSFFEKLLDHTNIEVVLGIDAKNVFKIADGKMYGNGTHFVKPVVYTGAIDELLNFEYGVLSYRSLRFEWKTTLTDSFQPFPVVAYPQAKGYTRITEYIKLPEQPTNGKSIIAVEYPLQYKPSEGTEPYYPILTEDNVVAHKRYLSKLEDISNLYLCGRLADYKYYNMDKALARALEVAQSIKV